MALVQYIGDDATHEIPLMWEGAAFDPAGWFLTFTAKYRLQDSDAEALFQKVSNIGLTVSGTVATVQVLREDTELLPKKVNLVCDIQARNVATGEVRTVAIERLKLVLHATREDGATRPIYSLTPGDAGGAGFFAMGVDGGGDLILSYIDGTTPPGVTLDGGGNLLIDYPDGTAAPDYSISGGGDLILTI